MDVAILEAVRRISDARNIVALTGAGISVESGIPPFRGKGGLWEKYDPMKYATIQAFQSDPGEVWRVLLRDMRFLLESAEPNDGHCGLARLEEMGRLRTVITQNVDGLHQRAGNTDVIEFHGNFAEYYCMDCGVRNQLADINLSELPPRCVCGGIFRPDCVFFGEPIPHDMLWRSQQAATQCDLMLVVGTSAIVQPAAFMPAVAKESGAAIIEINPEPTPLTGYISDVIVQGPAGAAMNRIIAELENELSP